MKVNELINLLIAEIEASNYSGWDIFDGLNSKLFQFDSAFKIDVKKISQVDKKTSIEWFDFSTTYDSVIIVVGDCATCTFKASQDTKELNDRNVPTYLITFSEMKSLIFQDTLNEYPEKLIYFDEKNFIEKLKKEFS